MTRGAGVPATALAEKLLDRAILQGVKRYDDKPAVGGEQRFGRAEPTFQLAEFIVDVNPQRLKRACRRVDAVPRMRNNASDDLC